MPHSGFRTPRRPNLTGLLLLAALSVQCQGESSSSETPNAPSIDRIAAFEAWREKDPPVDSVTVYGFLTADWYHRDGRIHYFVSELHQFETKLPKGAPIDQCAEAARLDAEFRKSIAALVANWPDRPKLAKDFVRRTFFTGRDVAEARHNDYLAHRHNDAIELHRIWLR